MVQLEYIVKGKAGSQSARTRLPITPEILRKLKMAWAAMLRPFDAAMLWAMTGMWFVVVG